MWYGDRIERHCRWCGIAYGASRPIGRDGFHTKACKQAHHRAYKKYVTARSTGYSSQAKRPVTQKKRKKQGK